MRMSMRWFGDDDPVTLENIKQVPGVRSIVSAIYDVPVGLPWPRASVAKLQDRIQGAGLELGVIESVPVPEDIKLGGPARDELTDNFCESLRVLGEEGIEVVCYNFMPVFDWTRTELSRRLADGSFALAYEDAALERIGLQDLPGWATTYTRDQLDALLTAYRSVDAERLWENFVWFLERVVPVAAEAGVRLAVHPDDPPWPIFGLPRILTNAAAFERLIATVDHPANGVTFCTGSLGASADNDLPAMIRRLAGRIHFAHCRNVKRAGARDFSEVAHPSRFGDVDMAHVVRALKDIGFDGCIRPDHGRMIWGESGRAGYGLYDRALGAMYLQGLWEGIR